MADYYVIPTNIGEAKMANALALGIPLAITELAVGDGEGEGARGTPLPNPEATTLVSERRRAPLNSFAVDPNNSNALIAEQIIPESAGGWWIREMGLFDEDGDLIFVCNTPPTYKPQLTEGSGRVQVVRMASIVSDTAAVTLKVDPSLVLATRQYAQEILAVHAEQVEQEINERLRYVGNVDDMQALPLNEGESIRLTQSGRSGIFFIKSGVPPIDPHKGIYIPLANGNYAERIEKYPLNPEWYGAVADGTDQSEQIEEVNKPGIAVNLNGNSYTYAGAFAPAAKFYNGKIVASNREFNFGFRTVESPALVLQSRSIIDYDTSNSVKVFVPESLVLSGFRFHGSYRKPSGRAIATGVNGSISVNDNSDLSILTTRKMENWYAVFAGANESDTTASFVNLPFFRAFSVTGNEITLGEGKETTGEDHVQTSYDMAIDVMVGADALIIQENGKWSGRTTTVTSNTAGSITLSDASGVSPGDFVLVAPPEFSDYCYLGSWYLDTNSPRNRADTGYHVAALHFQIPGLAESGAIPKTEVSVRCMISPLATAYIAKLRYVVNSTGTGKVNHIVDNDSSGHALMTVEEMKYGSLSMTPSHQPVILPFARKQSLWITSGGDLAGLVTGRQLQCYGWIEP
jgi:hypothetical protein